MLASTPHPSSSLLDNYLDLFVGVHLVGWARLTKWQRIIVRNPL